MYIMELENELHDDVYRRFIDYALNKSDSFMLVVRKHKVNVNQINDEAFFQYYKRYFSDEQIKQMIKKNHIEIERMEEQAKEFYKTEEFLLKMNPYLIKKRHNANWPSGNVIIPNGDEDFEVLLYRVCKEIKNYLLEVKNIYDWFYPSYPEDLSFFKNNICWFSSCSHERRSFIYAHSLDEEQIYKSMGIFFYSIEKTNNIYKEDY